MAMLRGKISSLKVLFLCSISVSVGPFSSVILSEHPYKSSTISDVLVVSASAMYCISLSPIVLKLRLSFLNTSTPLLCTKPLF